MTFRVPLAYNRDNKMVLSLSRNIMWHHLNWYLSWNLDHKKCLIISKNPLNIPYFCFKINHFWGLGENFHNCRSSQKFTGRKFGRHDCRFSTCSVSKSLLYSFQVGNNWTRFFWYRTRTEYCLKKRAKKKTRLSQKSHEYLQIPLNSLIILLLFSNFLGNF